LRSAVVTRRTGRAATSLCETSLSRRRRFQMAFEQNRIDWPTIFVLNERNFIVKSGVGYRLAAVRVSRRRAKTIAESCPASRRAGLGASSAACSERRRPDHLCAAGGVGFRIFRRKSFSVKLHKFGPRRRRAARDVRAVCATLRLMSAGIVSHPPSTSTALPDSLAGIGSTQRLADEREPGA
jgi:hypothetical protein